MIQPFAQPAFMQPVNLNLGLGAAGKASSPGGRPNKVSGGPIVLRDPGMPEGFDFNFTDVEAIKSAKNKYLKEGKNQGMPGGIQPLNVNTTKSNVTSKWTEQQRGRKIMMGHNRRRSQGK